MNSSIPVFSYDLAYQMANDHQCPRCGSDILVIPKTGLGEPIADYFVICSNCQNYVSNLQTDSRTIPDQLLINPGHFWENVFIPITPNDDPDFEHCWVWMRSQDRSGYGWCRVGKKIKRAHRVAYQLARPIDPLQKGLIILHECDHPYCVNPLHLRQGTYAENSLDMYLKNRQGGRIMTLQKARQLLALHAAGDNTTVLSFLFGIGLWQTEAIIRGFSWAIARSDNRRSGRKPRNNLPLISTIPSPQNLLSLNSGADK